VPRRLRRDPRIGLASKFAHGVQVSVEFPTSAWRYDIIGFAKAFWPDITWTERQKSTLISIQNGSHITIRGGRKSGKTMVAAVAVWWYVCTFPNALVVLLAPVGDSIDRIMWRQLTILYNTSAIDLGGSLHIKANDGWTDGTRVIFGRAPKDASGVRGLSGANMFVVADEASDITEDIWETLDGNMSGSLGPGRAGKALLISNPTRLQGFFYRSHKTEARWDRVHMPAEARDDIPGMTGSTWIGQMAEYYGVDSTHYIVHVLGDFPSVEEDRIVHESWLQDAIARRLMPDPAEELTIGFDPATSENNDEAAWAPRRGLLIYPVECARGMDFGVLADRTCELAEKYRITKHEKVRVVLDAQGPVGNGTYKALREVNVANNITLVPLWYDQFRRRCPTLAKSYHDLNAARWGEFARALRAGLQVPDDRLLYDELLFPTWVQRENGKRAITRKEEFREQLGRSPDRADAVLNSTWSFESTAVTLGEAPVVASAAQPSRKVNDLYRQNPLYGPRAR
jgi:hypothetical protein